ncbi:MAG: hypothetical protein HYY48_09945 [Gammaproteobacteria bacterium]|nr:hypothetical protein [Gammaproteobacteria bacterium]
MGGRRIAILMHERDDRQSIGHYAIATMMDFWRKDGHRMTLLYGTGTHKPADILIVHVDLSVVPREYLDFALQYPIALNAGVADIRKTTFADNLLDAGDPYDGPVIVKSNLNHGGFSERRIANLEAGRPRRKVPPPDYPIFEQLAAVPRDCFNRADLVVQKFQPERDGDFYCIRNLHFIGDHLSCIRRKARGPIVGGERYLPEFDVVEPHPEMLAVRERLGLDYGKFDYVVVDGRPILLDINKTVGNSSQPPNATLTGQRRVRARGLYAYFRGMRPFPVPRTGPGLTPDSDGSNAGVSREAGSRPFRPPGSGRRRSPLP